MTLGLVFADFWLSGWEPAGLPYSDVVITFDDVHIVNEAFVTRAGGTRQSSSDSNSQRRYLVRTFEQSDVHTETDRDSLYLAQGIVGRFKDATLRIDSLTIQPQRDPANLFPVVLSLELLDRIRVQRTPQGVGAAIDEELIIQGIEIDATPETWTVTYRLAPKPASAWLLGDDVYGVLGSTTRLHW